jgi:hypothetical protein
MLKYKQFRNPQWVVEDEVNAYLAKLDNEGQAVVKISTGRYGENNKGNWVEIWSAPKSEPPPNLQF